MAQTKNVKETEMNVVPFMTMQLMHFPLLHGLGASIYFSSKDYTSPVVPPAKRNANSIIT